MTLLKEETISNANILFIKNSFLDAESTDANMDTINISQK